MARVPLAWRNLTSDGVKFLIAVSAIAFAVTLLFVQLGFYFALMDSAVRLIDAINADLVLVHEGREYISYRQGFPRQVLDKLRGTPGVGSVHALTMDVTLTRLLDPDRIDPGRSPPGGALGPMPGERLIRVLGVDPEDELLDLPELARTGPHSRVADLRRPGQGLFDRRSRGEYGLAKRFLEGDGEPFDTELAGQRLRLVGEFDLGRDFTAEGNVLLSEETFRAYLRSPFPFLPDDIDLGLVRVARRDGAPVEPVAAVQDRVNAALEGTPVRAHTVAGLGLRERAYWRSRTPIGQVFLAGLFMGVGVGAIICYQILSSGVADRLPEYATLRAIGYSNAYLGGVVLQEALILAAVGFLPGLVAAFFVFRWLEWMTELPLRFTPCRVAFVFVVSVVMCAVAALVAVREAQSADPAEVFG